jgi:hypothetical protein
MKGKPSMKSVLESGGDGGKAKSRTNRRSQEILDQGVTSWLSGVDDQVARRFSRPLRTLPCYTTLQTKG